MFTPLLGGLDAAELMTLAPPGANYQIVYKEAEDSPTEEEALGKELEVLRLKDLRRKAKELGVDNDAL